MLRTFMPITVRGGPSPALLAMLLAGAVIGSVACGPRADGVDRGQGDSGRGRALVEQHQCGRCHAIPGVAGADGKAAVTLASMGVRSYIAGRVPNRPETMAAWIVDPPSLVPGTAMPRLGVSMADARDMAAYLESLP